ncbi:hypothetical protein [Paraburkholderia azotifigens]|uniref:Uncharacterized protein n=1 Tax=Paraburkholderia azotifigens TaxID=2057004 RepID=A0A5C6VED9_9BURK|nr:hypothetical protein [Paraburkholderia azotifigens]TXC83752.1 hypothetical protein FRZ40_25700 [Paraburkholderia azotifigens]
MVASLIALARAIFISIPAVSRQTDRNAGRLLAQARVVASSGNSMVRMGAASYRFTAYEKRLVVCLLASRACPYKSVRVLQDRSVRSGNLTIALDGVRVELWGNAESLARLAKMLSLQGCART